MNAALLCITLVLAGSAEDALKEASERYARGDAAGAADAYESAVAQGADGVDVYFNLGTAALRAGDVGRAVWALMEARARDPWDDDVRFNLELARKENPDTLVGSEEPAWMSALLLIPRAPLGWAAFALFVAFCALLTLRGLLGPSRAVERAARWTGALTFLLGALVLVVESTVGAPAAVVVSKEAVVRSTERVDGPEAFRVHAGLPVRPMAPARGGLVRIRLANGLEGYAPEEAIRVVGGPPSVKAM
ncbi:MAG: hypothetical protein AB2A00_31835 [Myxococcota bacterium]